MSGFLRSRRGIRMEGRLFIYIVAIFLGALFLIFGYRAIIGIGQKGEQAALINLKNELDKDVQAVRTEIGSVKIGRYNIPSTFYEVCFVDLTNADPSELDNPVIRDSLESGNNKNVFLIQESNIQTLYIEDLGVKDYPHFLCVFPRGGTIEAELEGMRDGVSINVTNA
jgi:hypothetical protein